MKAKHDLTGQKFSELEAVKYLGAAEWECKCSCGNYRRATTNALRNGKAISCGCKSSERFKKMLTKHGYRSLGQKHPVYETWSSMRARCMNPKNRNYHNYGGRGISICDRWMESFQNFLDDMGMKPSKAHSIDRIDNNGPYSPENCKWSTQKEQASNNRRNRLIKFNGEIHTLTQWAEKMGVRRGLLESRILYYGWSIERDLTTVGPLKACERIKTTTT